MVGVVGLLGSREGEGELRANRERTLFRRKRSGTPEGCQEVKGQEASQAGVSLLMFSIGSHFIRSEYSQKVFTSFTFVIFEQCLCIL